MCTAITLHTKDHFFGRNLDLELSFGEEVVITPRNYPFHFRKTSSIKSHYAIIGMALIKDDYPLYFDATNEEGLSAAGLNFNGYAYYNPDYLEDHINITPFELIPWLLSQFKSVDEVLLALDKLNLIAINFNQNIPLSPLHWIIADKNRSITLEATKKGLNIYDNPCGVLCNNPSFDYHLLNLNNYMHLSPKQPNNNFSHALNLVSQSRGTGGLGLPGDLSSSSRFIRATFNKMNGITKDDEKSSVNHFFKLLASVEQIKGLNDLGNDEYEMTIYSSCVNLDKGIYYYKTYDNPTINAIYLNNVDLNSDKLIAYPLNNLMTFNKQN